MTRQLSSAQLRVFVSSIEKPAGDDGCWFWLGATNCDGYGVVGPGVMTHRLAYELMVGDIPEGLELDHLCRNRACANPHHLEPVCHAENLRRSRDNQQRPYQRYCRNGHALTTDNVRMWSNGTHRREHCYACHRQRVARR